MRGAGQRSSRIARRFRFIGGAARIGASCRLRHERSAAFADRTAGRNLRHNESVLAPARIQHPLIRKSRQTNVTPIPDRRDSNDTIAACRSAMMGRIDPVESRWKSDAQACAQVCERRAHNWCNS
jgi:hypothetical protein